MRIVFCGSPDAAVPSLEALARTPGHSIVRVLTQPDRPAGRGRRTLPSPVRTAAESLGLEVRTPGKPGDLRDELVALAPDLVAVVAYGHILRRWLLELPPLGCVNVHFSLLPRHRGVAPVAWAILSGDDGTGVSTMQLDRGVDTGPVYLAERMPIGPHDTAGSLTARLAASGAALLLRTIEGIERGAVPVPQDDAGATYARRLEKEDGRLDWTMPAAELDRRVRGLSPWPGTFTLWRDRKLKVHRVRPVDGDLPPGELRVDGTRVLAGAGAGILELLEVQPEGKARIEAAAWWRGARPAPGERLGA